MTEDELEVRNHEVIRWIVEHLQRVLLEDDGPAQGAVVTTDEEHDDLVNVRGNIDLGLLAQDVLAVALFLISPQTEVLGSKLVQIVEEDESEDQ